MRNHERTDQANRRFSGPALFIPSPALSHAFCPHWSFTENYFNGANSFRFRDTSSSCDASSKRYVITNPPDDFSLLPTDQVRCVALSCSTPGEDDDVKKAIKKFSLYTVRMKTVLFWILIYVHTLMMNNSLYEILSCLAKLGWLIICLLPFIFPVVNSGADVESSETVITTRYILLDLTSLTPWFRSRYSCWCSSTPVSNTNQTEVPAARTTTPDCYSVAPSPTDPTPTYRHQSGLVQGNSLTHSSYSALPGMATAAAASSSRAEKYPGTDEEY